MSWRDYATPVLEPPKSWRNYATPVAEPPVEPPAEPNQFEADYAAVQDYLAKKQPPAPVPAPGPTDEELLATEPTASLPPIVRGGANAFLDVGDNINQLVRNLLGDYEGAETVRQSKLRRAAASEVRGRTPFFTDNLQGPVASALKAGESTGEFLDPVAKVLGESAAVGMVGGVPGVAGYYAGTTFQDKMQETGDPVYAGLASVIEGGMTLAGGKLLGAGAGQLASKVNLLGGDGGSVLGKIASRAIGRSGLPDKIKAITPAIGGGAAETVEELLTETLHATNDYLVGGDKRAFEGLAGRLWEVAKVAGPAGLIGGGAASFGKGPMAASFKEAADEMKAAMAGVEAAVEDSEKSTKALSGFQSDIPTSRRGFEKATGRKIPDQAGREAYAETLAAINQNLNPQETSNEEAVQAPQAEGQVETLPEVPAVGGESITTPAAPEQAPVAPEPAPAPGQPDTVEVRPEAASDLSGALHDAIPGARLQQRSDREFQVDLPNGRFFTLKLEPELKTRSKKRIDFLLKMNGLENTPENRDRIKKNGGLGRFTVGTPDGELIDGMGVMQVLDKLDRPRMTNTIRHEAVHLARSFGMFTDQEWDALVGEHSDPSRSAKRQEEDIARASKLWKGETSLTDRIKALLNRILSFVRLSTIKPATAQQAATSGAVFARDAKRNVEAVQTARDQTNEALSMDMTAFHGSPHTFSKFSTEKIGTGEGAQAYGHGLYFAGAKEVAEYYKKTLGNQWQVKTSEGQIPLRDYIDTLPNVSSPMAYVRYHRETTGESITIEKAAELYAADPRIKERRVAEDVATFGDIPTAERMLRNNGRADLIPSLYEFKKKLESSGKLYSVDLKPAEDEYLLWDRPLSEQSEKVKAALKEMELPAQLRNAIFRAVNGEETEYDKKVSPVSGITLYRLLASKVSDKWASDYLRSLGIRGIKYLDGSSRNATLPAATLRKEIQRHKDELDRIKSYVGESYVVDRKNHTSEIKRLEKELERAENSSYNYVIFDDSDVEILSMEQLEEGQQDDRYLGRANPGITPEQRQTYNQTAEAHGPPQHIPREVPQAAAAAKLTKDYQGRLAKWLKTAESAKKSGVPFKLNSEETFEVQQLLRAEMNKAVAGDREAESHHVLLTEQLIDSRSEAGRTLGIRDAYGNDQYARHQALVDAVSLLAHGQSLAFGKLSEELKKTSTLDMAEIKTRLKSVGIDLDSMTLEQIAADTRMSLRMLNELKALGSPLSDRVFEFWRNMILSGPQTQLVNTIGNMTFGQWITLAENTLAGVINKAVRNKNDPRLSELKYAFGGMLPGMARGARNAIISWSTETPSLAVELGQLTQKEIAGRDQMRGYSIPGKFGKFTRAFAYRELMAADEFARSILHEQWKGMLAYRMAKEQGLEGEALTKFIAEQVSDPLSDASVGAMEIATHGVFQGEAGVVAKRFLQVGRALRKIPGARYLVNPFIETPANLYEEIFKRVPIIGAMIDVANAPGDSIRSKAKSLRETGLSSTLARQIIGFAVTMAFLYDDEDEPWLTGANHNYDPLPPQSIRIPFTDKWLSYARFQPMAGTLATIADAVDGYKNGTPIGSSVASLVSQTKDTTYLRGIADLASAAEEAHRTKSPDGFVRWATSPVMGFVPNVYQQTARGVRNYIPERGLWGEGNDWYRRMFRRLGQNAGLRFDTQPKVDVLGNDIEQDAEFGHPSTDFLFRVVAPTILKEAKMHPMDQALLKYNNSGPNKQLHWPDVSRTYEENGETKYLTDEQHYVLQKLAGKWTKESLDGWKGWDRIVANPTKDDIKAIQKTISEKRTYARNALKPYWRKGESGAEKLTPQP